jgi:hypothetical protein
MSEWTPTTHEVARAVSFHKVVPRHEDEDFASWLGRTSIEGFMAQLASEEAFSRWLASVKADAWEECAKEISQTQEWHGGTQKYFPRNPYRGEQA